MTGRAAEAGEDIFSDIARDENFGKAMKKNSGNSESGYWDEKFFFMMQISEGQHFQELENRGFDTCCLKCKWNF